MRCHTNLLLLSPNLLGIGLLGISLLAAPLRGQDPAPGTPRSTTPAPEGRGQGQQQPGRAALTEYSGQGSRELFTACDGDSDDRLDLFEACEAIESLGDPTGTNSFLAIDTDRNGYVGWSEFDAHFRSVIERGLTFRVRTCRRFSRNVPELKEAKVATPLDHFMRLHDENENGGLDPEEVEKIAKELKLPTLLKIQLQALDLDQSGQIEQKELAPFFGAIRSRIEIPGVDPKPTEPVTTKSALPLPWQLIDSDGDNHVDLEELRGALRRVAPGLARWASFLLQRFDANENGTLEDGEIPRPAEPDPDADEGSETTTIAGKA